MVFGFRAIFRAQREGWLTFLIVVPLFLVVVTLVALLPKRYEANMSVVASQYASSFGSEAAALSSPLSFLTGGALGEKVTNFQLYMNVLRGREVAESILAQPDLLKALLGEGRWDEETQSWISKENVLDEWFDYPAVPGPTVDEVVDALTSQVKIAQRSVPEAVPAPIFDISISLPDAAKAKEILIRIHQSADDYVRATEIEHLKAWQDFLQTRIPDSVVLESRAALSSIYSTFYTRSIVANADGYFAAQIVDPPHVSSEPVLPRPLSLYIIGVFVGLFFSCVYNFIGYCLRNIKVRALD